MFFTPLLNEISLVGIKPSELINMELSGVFIDNHNNHIVIITNVSVTNYY